MKKFTFIILILSLFAAVFAQNQTKDFTRYVNPFIGTGGHGHTFPGATVPFGMMQLSPDTRTDNWDGSSGYHYSDNEIFGFSHTHLSGTGIPDYCDILLTPEIDGNVDRTFSHTNEMATAGYYSVKMNSGLMAELTATKRAGLHRYTFPDSAFVNIFLSLKWRDKVLDSELKVVGKNRIEGFRRSSSWAKDQIVYFALEFSKPFASQIVTFDEEISSFNQGKTEARGTNIGVALRFKNPDDKQIVVKVAISPVSIEGARKNLNAEIPGWDFEKVRNDAREAWNKELSKIEVSGGSDAQMKTFYTALYHTMIAPNIFQDVDGSYLGLDKKIHKIADNPKSEIQNPKSENYTVFSLWDTFRAAHPLYTIIDEKRTSDFINTFIRQYEQGGRLPVWELAANETDTMIGYHAVPVIADAIMKGIKGFDYDKAFAAALHSSKLNIYGLEAYRRRGYISMEDENESVSKTLEYAYDDHCIGQMALILSTRHFVPGNDAEMKRFSELTDLAIEYAKRSRSFENLFDPETGFMRPKQNGGFIKNFQPQEVSFHFTEGNSWVYSFFVPQDIPRLIDLMGGKEKFARKLDELFTTNVRLSGREQPDITGLIGQYAHGNEPSHHIAYLYDYADEPWKTQFYVRKILDEFYKPAPDGLIGNEDCGQMSAWYVLSASGFYEVSPNSALYVLGTPLFKEARFNLENGKTFIVKAPNVSRENFYIRSATLNGTRLKRPVISHDDIKNGGKLEFEMSNAPVKDAFDDFRVSAVDEINKAADAFVAVPVIESDQRTFYEKATITLRAIAENAKIRYTLDGTTPTTRSQEYRKPILFDKSVTIKAIALDTKGSVSDAAEASFYKMPHDWDVALSSTYNRQYTGGGPQGLIDGLRGTTNFASGEWQGYQDQDLIAVIDLKKETEIESLGGGFLQVARSWIWMPTHIEFEVSADGEGFTKVADIKTDVAVDDMTPTIRDYRQKITPVTTRYVRVRAFNLGKIPAWHPGSGFDAFIFVDEIFIE